MKLTILPTLALIAAVAAAPIDYGSYPPPAGGYGSYPAPAGGYGSYNSGTPPAAPAGGYGDYPAPAGGYGTYPTPAGGYGSYPRAVKDMIKRFFS